jgi:hypothetical protein
MRQLVVELEDKDMVLLENVVLARCTDPATLLKAELLKMLASAGKDGVDSVADDVLDDSGIAREERRQARIAALLRSSGIKAGAAIDNAGDRVAKDIDEKLDKARDAGQDVAEAAKVPGEAIKEATAEVAEEAGKKVEEAGKNMHFTQQQSATVLGVNTIDLPARQPVESGCHCWQCLNTA